MLGSAQQEKEENGVGRGRTWWVVVAGEAPRDGDLGTWVGRRRWPPSRCRLPPERRSARDGTDGRTTRLREYAGRPRARAPATSTGARLLPRAWGSSRWSRDEAPVVGAGGANGDDRGSGDGGQQRLAIKLGIFF